MGHKKAIIQPFDEEKREFNEIVISTILMLEITDMVKAGENSRTVQPEEIRKQLLNS